MIDTRNVSIEKRRVRHARITVTPDLQVRLVVPLRTTRAEIDALIERKSKWIQKQLDRFKKRDSEEIKLDHDEILLLGEIYRFQRRPELNGRSVVDAGERTVSSGRNLLADGALERWYIDRARRLIAGRLAHFSREHGFDYGKVSIRDQKTRWGSCSAKKNLSFSWRLVQLPPDILDYVVVHELVHTNVLNHSKAFWAEVGSICPDYKQAVEQLRRCHPGRQPLQADSRGGGAQ